MSPSYLLFPFRILSLPMLLIFTVLVFLSTFFNDFQQSWDDNWQVLNNPYVLETSWDNLSFHFVNFHKGQYSPINTLFYIGVYNLFGFSPAAFHGLSLLIHLCNIIFVFWIIQEIMSQITLQKTSFGNGYYAFIAALIFALHPLQVESVAWISASKVVLYTFFILLALQFYIRYIKTKKWLWLLGVGFAYLLSFGSKEQAIILPLNLLATDYVYGRFSGFRFRQFRFYQKVIVEKLPFFALAAGMWYFSALNALGSLQSGSGYPFYQRVVFGMHSLSEYLFRFLAPVKLYYFYFFPSAPGESLPWYYWGYLLIMLCIGLFVWHHYKRNNKLILFGLLFFLINIILVLHLLPMPREMITADRYMYLSMVGLALVLAWGIDYACHHYSHYKRHISLALSLYILALGTQSFFRTQDWKDSEHIKHNIKVLIEKREQAGQSIINNPLADE